jgi:EAL domain-containing protein (putative c-di-GMP-specific phosphodiesterase class I)
MRDGLGRGEFLPYFQPMIDLGDGELKGFEVLARWHHPQRGVLMPEEFIPIAEESGIISSLSLEVMRQALAEARGWPGYISIAVNVSPVQFKDPLLAQRILQLLTETGFPPQRLEIELTESALLEDQALALSTVESLKNSGVRISLDDFGTGYASLSQLKSLPFDRIKIDRSFVSSLLEDEQSSAIVATIAELGKSLRLPITAEGVETEDVRKQLQLIGCSDAQGWLFGKAVPAESIRQMLDSTSGTATEVGRIALAAEGVAVPNPRKRAAARKPTPEPRTRTA